MHFVLLTVSDDLGLTSKQKKDLAILIHVLYSNPKVLYAPNGTEADVVIAKVGHGGHVIESSNDPTEL